ncbi:MAG: leucine-rich repeat domain-containing protein [Acidobacteria bacterium]|nr:leucine-rich repeat domain-containing protein [Acidobacteriota bacterium]
MERMRYKSWASLALLSLGFDLRSADPPLFPDPVLEAAVRQQVFSKRDNKEPLTADDVKSISTVLARKGVKSLAGLEKCTAIASVEITDGEVADLAPLKGLTNIQFLRLANNRITDLAPLAALTGLQYLDITNNQVSSLEPLAKITTMNTLIVTGNRISDLGPLGEMKRLWSLYAAGNQITNLKPLAGLGWLSSLDLQNNGLKDLAPLAPLTSLNFLMLDGNAISDLTPLLEMARKDTAGEKRFAPYWQITITGNPLPAAALKTQIPELKKLTHTVTFGTRPAPKK